MPTFPLKATAEMIGRYDWRKVRVIGIMHVLSDTVAFIRELRKAGASVDKLYAKPFSIDDRSLAALQADGFVVERHPYSEIEETTLLDESLETTIKLARENDQKVVIVDVGGYFCAPLQRLHQDAAEIIAGVVEVTTFGHNRYKRGVALVPARVMSIARSELKDIEAIFVGKSAVLATDLMLRGAGIALAAKKALMIGYGMIGRQVAQSVKAQGIPTSVFDRDDVARLWAVLAGFEVGTKEDLLAEADLVFSATAEQSIAEFELPLLKDYVVLASVGSKGNEFDIAAIQRLAVGRRVLSEQVVDYQMPWQKTIRVLKGGTAVNFYVNSCPDQAMDLVFAEIASCMIETVCGDNPLGIINELRSRDRSVIAGLWLKSHLPPQ